MHNLLAVFPLNLLIVETRLIAFSGDIICNKVFSIKATLRFKLISQCNEQFFVYLKPSKHVSSLFLSHALNWLPIVVKPSSTISTVFREQRSQYDFFQ